MYLKRGIAVYSELTGIASQLTINTGTVEPGTESGLYYHPGSVVPKRNWRSLEAGELKALLGFGTQADYRKSIYIGEVPKNLQKSLQALGLHDCKKIDEVIPEVKKREQAVKTVSDILNGFLEPLSSSANYKFHRITRAMPGRETITCHYINERFVYIGLHIDQSRAFTPHTAFKSGNRISINLSSETRFLLFVNLTMIQASNMLIEKAGLTATEVTADNISTLFFKHFPGYPVVKIAVKPYQYYVAPTDNFFHDATTMGNSEIDVTIVYTGVFDMPHLKNYNNGN